MAIEASAPGQPGLRRPTAMRAVGVMSNPFVPKRVPRTRNTGKEERGRCWRTGRAALCAAGAAGDADVGVMINYSVSSAMGLTTLFDQGVRTARVPATRIRSAGSTSA